MFCSFSVQYAIFGPISTYFRHRFFCSYIVKDVHDILLLSAEQQNCLEKILKSNQTPEQNPNQIFPDRKKCSIFAHFKAHTERD